jgi:multicomponent Na+:H+ antiporter subunit D
MVWEHLQIGVIALPLMAAPLVALLGRSKLAPAFTLIVAVLTALMSWWLLWQVLAGGPLRYRLGNWPAPWGIEYRLDLFAAIVQTLVASVAAVMMPYLLRLLALEIPASRLAPALAAFLLRACWASWRQAMRSMYSYSLRFLRCPPMP